MVSAEWMAQTEDECNDIECGWATGKTKKYQKERDKYEVPKSVADAILELAGIDTSDPIGTSEYGGGSEACYWYNCENADGEPVLVIGIATCDACWAIPADVEIPDVENYKKKPDEACD